MLNNIPEERAMLRQVMGNPIATRDPGRGACSVTAARMISATAQADLDARLQCGWIEPDEHEARTVMNTALGMTLTAHPSPSWADPDHVQWACGEVVHQRQSLAWYRQQCGEPLPLVLTVIRWGIVFEMEAP